MCLNLSRAGALNAFCKLVQYVHTTVRLGVAVLKEPLLKSIMTPFPYSIASTASLTEAREMMQAHGVRHLPVTSSHQLTGLLDINDIDSETGKLAGGTDPGRATVKEVLAERGYYSVDLDQPLHAVLREMAHEHLSAAVVTTHGRLAGIFTATDACRAFAEHLDRQFRPGEDEPPEAA